MYNTGIFAGRLNIQACNGYGIWFRRGRIRPLNGWDFVKAVFYRI